VVSEVRRVRLREEASAVSLVLAVLVIALVAALALALLGDGRDFASGRGSWEGRSGCRGGGVGI
jgi:hypothetical protein